MCDCDGLIIQHLTVDHNSIAQDLRENGKIHFGECGCLLVGVSDLFNTAEVCRWVADGESDVIDAGAGQFLKDALRGLRQILAEERAVIPGNVEWCPALEYPGGRKGYEWLGERITALQKADYQKERKKAV